MGVTVIMPPLTTDLTTLARAKVDLGLTDSSQDAWLSAAIAQSSAAIVSSLGMPLARQQVRETISEVPPNTGLVLTHTPLAQLVEVTRDGTTVTDTKIRDAHAGIVWTPLHWASGLYELLYWGGYLLPGDDRPDIPLSASAVDHSFTSVDGEFPLLVPGDRLWVNGFAIASNNGYFTVSSRSAFKVVVEALLTSEAEVRAELRVSTLPPDLERLCLATVGQAQASQGQAGGVESVKVGDLSISYGATSAGTAGGTESVTATHLERWGRII